VLLEQVQKMRLELEETRKTVMTLKESTVRLQMDTDEYKKQLVDAQNDSNKLKADINDLHRDRQRLAEDLANAEYVLKEMAKKGHILPQVASIPEVRTKVVDVRNTGNVALGAGSDSGIKEGVIFLISRKDKYIGKVRVTTVWNDFAGGQVIEQKQPMMPGDDARSTRGS
jgi:chromosome segregation ATPase